MADSPVPNIISSQGIGMAELVNFIVSNKLAARISGIESKNEKRAAALRLIPSNKAAVMVMPEREVPGIKARA